MACPLTSCELAQIAAASADCLFDSCQIAPRVETSSGPYSTPAWTYGATIACGFQALSNSEADGSQFGTNKARLRVPIGTAITSGSRVKIISKFGATLTTSPTFAVVGEPSRGAAFLTCDLDYVAAGSES
jgi:hypothetical protein